MVESRMKARQLRTALREIVQQFGIPIRLTPHHNVIFDIEPELQQAIQEIQSLRRSSDPVRLTRYGIQWRPALRLRQLLNQNE